MIGNAFFEGIKAAGFDVITPVIVTNSVEYGDVKMVASGVVSMGEKLLELIK